MFFRFQVNVGHGTDRTDGRGVTRNVTS